jgi:uncharacterized membrane protein YeaQ/YmgE (transglycosylase-associated protein family)
LLVPGREPGGWVVSMALGVVGSFLGGFLGRGLSIYREGEPAGFLMSLLGAIIVVVALNDLPERGGSQRGFGSGSIGLIRSESSR